MAKNSFCEAEQRRLHKLQQFQLSHHFKNVGYIIIIISVLGMFAKGLFEAPLWIKELLKNSVLIGLLVVSISKEKIEDEYLESLRSQSYRLSFVLGVLYALIQPYINYIVALVIRPEKATIDFSYFQVLFFMLLVQLLFFHRLKK